MRSLSIVGLGLALLGMPSLARASAAGAGEPRVAVRHLNESMHKVFSSGERYFRLDVTLAGPLAHEAAVRIARQVRKPGDDEGTLRMRSPGTVRKTFRLRTESWHDSDILKAKEAVLQIVEELNQPGPGRASSP
jgi:hypothetical protein